MHFQIFCWFLYFLVSYRARSAVTLTFFYMWKLCVWMQLHHTAQLVDQGAAALARCML